jgi:transposase
MLNESGFRFKKVIIAIGRCDLRCGIDGLSAIVRLKYNLDPLEKDTIFLFCGTRCDRLKGILWTGDQVTMLFFLCGLAQKAIAILGS